jgi:hypothetical protein
VVHCSIAVVAGRTDGRVVTETTTPAPLTSYERRKLDAEATLRRLLEGRAPLTIARSTAVCRPGGANLVGLATALLRRRTVTTTVRRLLSGNRNMRAVPVGIVARALAFLTERAATASVGLFQVSTDDDPEQGYRAVEARLAAGPGVALLAWPSVTAPTSVWSWVLAGRGQSAPDSYRCDSAAALADAVFAVGEAVGPAVEAFGRWFAARPPCRWPIPAATTGS